MSVKFATREQREEYLRSQDKAPVVVPPPREKDEQQPK